MAFPPVDSSGAPDSGAPVFTPDQMARVRRILSRSPYYVDDNARLRVSVTSSVVPVTVAIHTRRGLPDGSTVPAELTVTATQAYVTTQADFEIGESLLYNVVALVKSGSVIVGNCYVTCDLVMGNQANPFVLAALIGRQVTQNQPAGWPGTPVQTSTETEPAVRYIQLTTPGPGQNIVQTVPTGARWEILGFTCTLTTDATPGNREILLTCASPGLIIGHFPQGFFLTPSSAQWAEWFANFPEISSSVFAVNASAYAQPLIMKAGAIIETQTQNLAAADQFNSVLLTVREWLEVP